MKNIYQGQHIICELDDLYYSFSQYHIRTQITTQHSFNLRTTLNHHANTYFSSISHTVSHTPGTLLNTYHIRDTFYTT